MTNSSENFAIIGICQFGLCGRKTETAAIMLNLSLRDVRLSTDSHGHHKRLKKVYRCAVSYDSDAANVAHGSTND